MASFVGLINSDHSDNPCDGDQDRRTYYQTHLKPMSCQRHLALSFSVSALCNVICICKTMPRRGVREFNPIGNAIATNRSGVRLYFNPGENAVRFRGWLCVPVFCKIK